MNISEAEYCFNQLNNFEGYLYEGSLTDLGFTEGHKVTLTNRPKVGDYLYKVRANSGGMDDGYHFYRVIKVTPKRTIIQSRLFDGEGTIKQVHLKFSEWRYSPTSEPIYSYQSGRRYHFSQFFTAAEHKQFLLKAAAIVGGQN